MIQVQEKDSTGFVGRSVAGVGTAATNSRDDGSVRIEFCEAMEKKQE
jgi:hypothetical protein